MFLFRPQTQLFTIFDQETLINRTRDAPFPALVMNKKIVQGTIFSYQKMFGKRAACKRLRQVWIIHVGWMRLRVVHVLNYVFLWGWSLDRICSPFVLLKASLPVTYGNILYGTIGVASSVCCGSCVFKWATLCLQWFGSATVRPTESHCKMGIHFPGVQQFSNSTDRALHLR